MIHFKILLILFIIFTSALSHAQTDNDRKQFKDSIDKILRQKLIERLELDDATADRFLSTYKENNKQIRTINKEKKDLMESIELDPSAADMNSKLDKMLDLDLRIVELRKSFFNELRTFLSPQQIAKTMILRKNFDKQVRKKIMGQRKRGKNDYKPRHKK